MRAQCRDLTEAELDEQHRLYMAANGPRTADAPLVDVGGLLFCPIHKRALIDCHDERNPAQ